MQRATVDPNAQCGTVGDGLRMESALWREPSGGVAVQNGN
jgi:hypothetical protein